MLEIVAAYERDSLYFGVVRVRPPSEDAALEFGVTREGYLALRRILESRPFGSMPGVKHSFYFAGGYGRDSICVRIEEGMNGRKIWLDCPTSLVANLLWFFAWKTFKKLRHSSA